MAQSSRSSEPDAFSYHGAPGLSTDGTTLLPNPDNAIAVIGVACKFAGADSVEKLWDILINGRSQCRDLPKDRFPDWRFDRRAYPRKFEAHMIDDVDAFDHKFFNISSREATFMDPQQRLALQVAYQALESSEYFGRSRSERELDIGCYVATCTNEYHENVACHHPSAFSLTGSIRPFIAGKVSHHFGWTGPAIMLDAACAASGVAIHQACRAVATGECSAAVAGATNIFVSPDTFQDLAAGHFISPTGRSRSFESSADGYCRGEGVAFIVLKKLSTALRDNDPIKGIIASTAVGQNANETSITVPHGPSQMSLYKKALRSAGLEASDISYVEAHGTGTPVGDPIEVASIRGVFGSSSNKTYLGSLKSNIGHTEASSGMSGLIKVLLMMEKGVIPQQALFKDLNPEIGPLEPDGLEIPTRNVPWFSEFKAACVNNYGASGTNAAMIVTQPPCVAPEAKRAPTTRTATIDVYPISMSASSASSLASYCSTLLEFIGQSSDEKLGAQIAYHVSRRRNPDLPYSLCATISSLQELKDLLKSTVMKPLCTTKKAPRPVILFFGGQTGTMVSISRTFYDSSTVFRAHLNNCDEILQALGSPSILPGIFEPKPQSSIVTLHSTLFSAQFACAMAWLDCGLKPARLVGHSFGQLTALCVSSVLSLRDGLRLVVERARLIERLWGEDPGSMIAIESSSGPEKVKDLLQRQADLNLDIACYNGPRNFVVAGSTSSVDALGEILGSSPESFRWKTLPVTNAFHSALAEPVVEPLQHVANQLDFCDGNIPLELCSEVGQQSADGWASILPDLVASHVKKPVYFHSAVERITERFGACTWLEAGTGSGAPILRRALGDQISRHDIKSMSLDPGTFSPLKHLAEIVSELWRSGLQVQFWPFHQSQRHEFDPLNIPLYQFDMARHWLDWKDLTASGVEVQAQTPTKASLLQLVRRTKGGDEFRVNTRSEIWRERCLGYRILGASVCPISMLLELVSQAIEMTGHAADARAPISSLRDLAMQRPIPADLDTDLHLKISNVGSPQLWAFEASSDLSSGHVLISGTVSTDDTGSDEELARYRRLIDITWIGKISADAETDSIKGRSVYKISRDLLQFPESSQMVREISSKGNEAIGHLLALSKVPFAPLESFVQVPLLCLNILREERDNEIYINTGVGHANFKSLPAVSTNASQSWAIYAKFFESNDSGVSCDIFVFDSRSKKLSSFILNVTFTRVQTEKFWHTRDAFGTSVPSTPERISRPASSLECTKQRAPQISKSETYSINSRIDASTKLPDLTKALFGLLSRVADVDAEMLQNDVLISELGIDSLMAFDVTEEINNFFSIEIDLTEAATITDLGSLCEIIASKAAGYSYDSASSGKTSSETSDTAGSSTQASTSTVHDTKPLVHEDWPAVESDPSRTHDQSINPTTAVSEAFGSIREDFDIIAKRTGCDRFWSEVVPRQEELMASYIVRAFAKLGSDLSAVESGKQVPEIPHSTRNDRLVAEFVRFLRDCGIIAQSADNWIRTSRPVPVQSLPEDFERLLADFPQFASEHQLLHSVGQELAECLTDKVNPVTLLFGSPEKRKLMADQYLAAPIQSAASEQLSTFISLCSESLQAIDRPFRVLEIGGGTCGTTLPIVQTFAQLGIPIEYTFSDLSPSFVAAAKAKLAQYEFVGYRTLDITKDPEQGLKDHFDIIIATNVVHATPDACASVRHARRMLRPGGCLVLTEYTRRLRWLDFVFGQLDGWWLFNDGRDHAIMDERWWRNTLLRAGYQHVDWTRGESRESEILKIFLAF